METKKRSIEEISNDYSPYVPGDMKKFTKALKSAGYDIICIRLVQEYGAYKSEIEYVDDDGEFAEETIYWG